MVKQITNKINWRVILLLVIFAVFAYLRFNDLYSRIGFDWDQERDAYQVKQIVVDHKPTLIGPRVVNVHGFYLGPYYTYLIIPFYLLSNLHPLASVYFVMFVNTIFFLLAFFTIQKIWSWKHAVFLLSFWAINDLIIVYDTTPWNVLLIPFGIFAIWFILEKMTKDKNSTYWAVLGFTLSLFLHFHFQFIFLILFATSFIFLNRKNNPITFKNAGIAILGFAVLFLPLVLFDLRHEFINSKLFFSFFLNNPEKMQREYFSWVPVVTNLLLPLTIVKNEVLALILYGVVMGLLRYLTKHTEGFQKTFYASTLVMMTGTIFFFIIYGKRPSEYYFLFLYPFIFITIIDFFIKIRKAYILPGLILLLVVANLGRLMYVMQPNTFSLYYKVQSILELKKRVDGKKYNVSFNTDPGKNNGFKYLIEHYGLQQTGNPADPLVEVMVPPREGNVIIGGIGLKIPPELQN